MTVYKEWRINNEEINCNKLFKNIIYNQYSLKLKYISVKLKTKFHLKLFLYMTLIWIKIYGNKEYIPFFESVKKSKEKPKKFEDAKI